MFAAPAVWEAPERSERRGVLPAGAWAREVLLQPRSRPGCVSSPFTAVLRVKRGSCWLGVPLNSHLLQYSGLAGLSVVLQCLQKAPTMSYFRLDFGVFWYNCWGWLGRLSRVGFSPRTAQNSTFLLFATGFPQNSLLLLP